MKTLLFLISFFSFYHVFGQFPINTGTTNVDWFGQCTLTDDNNLLIVGTTNYIGNGASADVSLKKTDLNGNTLWNQSFGVGGSEDLASGIISTSDGGYIICNGHTRSYAGSIYTGGINYYSATYIIKVDANGNQIWAKSLGGTSFGDNYGVSVVENSNGEYICYGHVQHHNGCSGYATRILKLSSTGAVLWSNCLPVNPDLLGGFTRIQGENNYIGAHNLSGTVVLRKYNDNGVVTSQINYQYQGINTTSSKLISNSAGEFYFLGSSNNKAVVAKFDNSMNLLWDTTFLTQYNSRFSDLKLYGSNLVLVGDIEVVDATNEYDFWLVKITPTGQFLSEFVHPSAGVDVYSRGSAIYQNDIFITGQIASAGTNQYAVKINLVSSLCSNTASQIQSISCDSYLAPDGQTYINSGVFTATIPNSTGCDSTITIDLTIKSSTTNSIITSACENYTAPDGQQYTSSGIYTAVIPNSAGCDSTITIDLTVNQPTSSSISEHSCGIYTAPDGQVYSNTGTYTATIPNQAGCDSTITIDLNVTNIDNSVTVDGLLLSANQLIAGYQWLDCDNGNLEMIGEFNQHFEVTQNGQYAVEISYEGCVDTSQCVLIDYVGLESIIHSNISFYTYYETLNLTYDQLPLNTSVNIFDLQGKIVLSTVLNPKIDISILNNGFYFLQITNNSEVIFKEKFMKYD